MAKKVAILVEQDYQDLEVWYPLLRFQEAGFETVTVGTGTSPIYKGKYGYPVKADTTAEKARARDFAALVIPGGWAPDFLRRDAATIDLVRQCDRRKAVIGSICHGGWVLCTAGIAMGRRLTSFRAIKDDLANAGAEWVDAEVVVDGNLVTSRKPEDLPAFCMAMLRLLR